MSAEIELTRGYVSIVDDEDADLSSSSWQVNTKSAACYYAQRTTYLDTSRRTEQLHRIVMSRVLGRTLQRNEFIDHIDHDGLNNRRANLRICTSQQNQGNARQDKRNKSGYRGVRFRKDTGLWIAQITINKRNCHLGSYSTAELAYEAFCRAAFAHFGEFFNSEKDRRNE